MGHSPSISKYCVEIPVGIALHDIYYLWTGGIVDKSQIAGYGNEEIGQIAYCMIAFPHSVSLF